MPYCTSGEHTKHCSFKLTYAITPIIQHPLSALKSKNTSNIISRYIYLASVNTNKEHLGQLYNQVGWRKLGQHCGMVGMYRKGMQ